MGIKFLDLDQIVSPEVVEIKLNGKKHAFKEMSVGDFIWAQEKAQQVARATDETTIMQDTVEMLLRSFPTAGREDFMSLPINKLQALQNFTMEVALAGAEKAAEGASGKA